MTMLPLALLLGLHAVAPPALPPEPAGLELRWDAPPECPDRAQLLAAIDATLGAAGQAGAEAARGPLTVHGRVSAEPSAGFVVWLELDEGRAGTRELRGASCKELTHAAALVIAMTLDPRLLAQQHASEAEHVAPEPPPPVPTEPSAVPQPSPSEPGITRERPPTERARAPRSSAQDDAPPRPARPRLHGLGRAQAGVGGGPLPGATAVLGLAAGVGGRGWRAEVSASDWTPRTRTSAANPAVGVHVQLWALGADGCGEPRWRTLSFPLCAGLRAGAVHARGTGALEPRRVVARWVAIAIEPGLVWWARPRLGLALRGSGQVALARPSLRSEPSGTVFTSNPVGGSLSAGLELRLP